MIFQFVTKPIQIYLNNVIKQTHFVSYFVTNQAQLKYRYMFVTVLGIEKHKSCSRHIILRNEKSRFSFRKTAF